MLNNEFKKKVKKFKEKNQNLNVWQWQHYTFEKNILDSMKIAKNGMTKLLNKYSNEYNEFKLKII